VIHVSGISPPAVRALACPEATSGPPSERNPSLSSRARRPARVVTAAAALLAVVVVLALCPPAVASGGDRPTTSGSKRPRHPVGSRGDDRYLDDAERSPRPVKRTLTWPLRSSGPPRPAPVAEYFHLGNAPESFAAAYPQLVGINRSRALREEPGYRENCMDCVLVVADVLDGRDYRIARPRPRPGPGDWSLSSYVERGAGDGRRVFRDLGGYPAIARRMRLLGEGAVGIVHAFDAGGNHHVFTVTNQLGRVDFIDGHIENWADLDRWVRTPRLLQVRP
jgi:hypothetical protein